jgi:hypothetical protein
VHGKQGSNTNGTNDTKTPLQVQAPEKENVPPKEFVKAELCVEQFEKTVEVEDGLVK